MGVPFDKGRLMRRARERLARRFAVEGKESAEIRHAIDYISVSNMERVVGWLSAKGFTVEFCNGISVYSPAEKKIKITAKSTQEHQLYSLLHECGHLLIDRSSSRDYLYPNGYNRIDLEQKGRDSLHKVDVIAEEYEAWERGLRLAERLNICIRREEYDRLKAKSLTSYFRWALRRGRTTD